MMSASTTKFIKVRFLVTNSLMNEIEAVDYVEANSTNNLPEEFSPMSERTAFTFGVEIECYTMISETIDSARANGLVINREGYNHRDNAEGRFKMVRDGSLGCNARQNYEPIECVTPVLTNSTTSYKRLEKLCTALNDNGAYVGSDCGLHVHVGVENLTTIQYLRIFKNYARLQNIINSFMPNDRRNNSYARQLPSNFKSIDLENAVAEVENDKRKVAYKYFDCRYYVVNACSYERHKTIEFRQHNGSVDYTDITMWVAFCTKLVEYSKKWQIPSTYRSIDDLKFLNSEEKEYFKRLAENF